MVESTKGTGTAPGSQPDWAYPIKPAEDAIQRYFTKEALAYTPLDTDIFITNSKGEQQRLIFHESLPLKDSEKQYLASFRKYLTDNNLTIPPGYDDESRLVLRFLQGLAWKNDETHRIINEHFVWANQTMPYQIGPVEDLITKGVVYCFKRDKGQRPVIIINVERILESKAELDQLVYLANFQIDFLIRNCLLPGQIEDWTVILDFTNVGLTQIPQSLLKGMIASMSRNYRGRMFRLFAVHVAWLLRGMWKVVRPLIDEFTASKVNIYGSSDFEADILKVIDANCLEQKYGGKCPNKETNYFPPEFV